MTLLAAVKAEITSDPAGRGYAGQSAQAIADLLNASYSVAQPAVHQDVLVADVEAYLRTNLLIAGLEDWVASAPPGIAKQAARELLGIIASPRITMFKTGMDADRNNLLAMLGAMQAAGAGGLAVQHVADITAMTVLQPPPVPAPHCRWLDVILGIEGAPNAADAAIVAEALAS